VDVEERHTAKKLTDRRNGESAPSYVCGLKKESGSTKEAVTEKKSTWKERNENRKRTKRKLERENGRCWV
jgi:hypothetical protein